MLYKTFDKSIDPRGDLVCCEIHDETWHDAGRPCPVCLDESELTDARNAKAKKICQHRDRVRMAKIYRAHLTGRAQIISGTDALRIAYATVSFMKNEIKFLESET